MRAAALEYDRIALANVGPIREGIIHRDKMSVFMGPNNAGKTIAAKIIHGVCQADAHGRRQHQRSPAGSAPPSGRGSGNEIESAADAMAVIRHAGLRPDGLPAHGARTSSLSVHGPSGRKTRLDLASAGSGPTARRMPPAEDLGGGDARRSVYLPTARAGGAQHIMSSIGTIGRIAHMQGSLLSRMPAAGGAEAQTFRSGSSPAGTVGKMLAEARMGDLAQCVGILMEVLEGGLDEGAQGAFGRLSQGSIRVEKRLGVPAITYADPSGHSAEIGHAGSGVGSLLALAAGMHRVGPGGTFIVEEPESCLDPQVQLSVIDEMLRAADENGIGVVATTQSDFLVQKVLSLVSSGRLDRSDLGLYYFDRPPGRLTSVRRLRVDETGEAEQEMFTRALNSLIAGFSG